MATERTRIADPAAEMEQARAIAARYRHEFVDLRDSGIDHDLFRTVPVELMFRYNFVPLHGPAYSMTLRLLCVPRWRHM